MTENKENRRRVVLLICSKGGHKERMGDDLAPDGAIDNMELHMTVQSSMIVRKRTLR